MFCKSSSDLQLPAIRPSPSSKLGTISLDVAVYVTKHHPHSNFFFLIRWKKRKGTIWNELFSILLPSSEPSAQSRTPLPTSDPVMQRGCPHKQVNSQGWQSKQCQRESNLKFNVYGERKGSFFFYYYKNENPGQSSSENTTCFLINL